MKKLAIIWFCIAILVGQVSAQTKSVTGTVVDHWINNRGTSESVTVTVGSKRYEVFITRPDLRQPQIAGTVNEVGRVVRVYYTKIVGSQGSDGELRATKIVEVKNQPLSGVKPQSCSICGTWKYYDKDAQETFYLEITNAGTDRYRLVPGYPGVGGILWHRGESDGLHITDSDGIYLKATAGKFIGRFVSPNFRPTGYAERSYTVTVASTMNGKIQYSISSGGYVERFTATPY